MILTSCVTDPASAQSAGPVAQPTCVSLTPEANPYKIALQEGAKNIFVEFRNSANQDDVKLKAFSLLGKYTEHWSEFVDIRVDDTQMIRITLTYIDPVLLQYIALNNTLSNNPNIDASLFQDDLPKKIASLSDRNELLFVITVTAASSGGQISAGNQLRVMLPIREMVLFNSRDMRNIPTQADPFLHENMEISNKSVSGIVGFPISLFINNNCLWVMDSGNINLTLTIPYVMINSTAYEAESWSIPYRSLIPQDSPLTIVNTPVPGYDPISDLPRITQLVEPPSISSLDQKTYWEDMGRYLWHVLLPMLYP